MATISIRKVTTGVQTIQEPTPQTYTGSLALSLSEAIAGSSTTQITIAIDVSAVKAIAIMSTVAATLKTNSAGSPDNTIVLRANEPYIWHTNAYDSFLLTTDVTSLHMVVAGATAGTLSLEAVADSTP